jgi:hypothetical protein
MQCRADVAGTVTLLLGARRRRAPGEPQAGNAAEGTGEFVSDAGGEVTVGRVAAHRGEREYGEGAFLIRGRART